MQRRTFLRDAALGAVAISASGFIRFDGTKYIGDCETTTDILGPFYRPGSPVRTNLVIPDDPGTKILLSGKVKHNDCITPFKNAKVEIWHCSSKGQYDNSTDEFRYRGTTYTDSNGNYFFNTILPVPYGIGNGVYRPAHYHLMITAENYQPLVTQLYFSGDAYLSKDAYSSSPTAKRRILEVQTLPDKSKKVLFDISLSEKLAPEVAGLEKLVGEYSYDDKNGTVRFFRKNNTLWVKNEVFGYGLVYVGDNTFMDDDSKETFKFEIMKDGKIRMDQTVPEHEGQHRRMTAFR